MGWSVVEFVIVGITPFSCLGLDVDVWKNQTGKMKGQYTLTLQLFFFKKSWNMEMLPGHGFWRIIEK